MEKHSFEYSMKNIPTPTKHYYKLNLTEKLQSFAKRLRWRAFFYLNKDNTSRRETYGLKSPKCPPQIGALIPFEKDLMDIVNKVKFRRHRDEMQGKLKEDVKKITSSKDVYVKADKTRNYYKVAPQMYKEIVKNNVTRNYKKANANTVTKINMEAKEIATQLKIEDRTQILAETESKVTVKDHKESFHSNPEYRLINPTKSEIGKISKQITERINKELRKKLGLNQWQSSQEVTKWFRGIKEKEECKFIQMDIKEFYPNITEDILDKSLQLAKEHTKISQRDIDIIKHTKKSILFCENEPWIKKNASDERNFDVTMGSYDGAETSELVGIYIITQLAKITDRENIGLYRDDGLIVLRNKPARETDRIRKNIIKTFSEMGFKIEIKTQMKIVNFLDLTLNLERGTYATFRKEGAPPVYVHTSSNHPPSILKQIPKGVNRRLCDNSSDETIFENEKHMYQTALRNSGYQEPIFYSERTTKKRKRKRNVTWFNPPYNKDVATNVGKIFLQLINKHFPRTHILRPICNRHTLKLSYSCTSNMGKIIEGHNRKILGGKNEAQLPCNCRIKENCPMGGDCRRKSVVYKATCYNGEEETNIYIGATDTTWKARYANHQKSINNETYKNETTLSTHVWNERRKNREPTIKWTILRQSTPCRNTNKCSLCLEEKLAIITNQSHRGILNKRNEILQNCRHKRKLTLQNYTPNNDSMD